jgi:hypothetical protein
MATMTSDGRTFVYAVFGSDGCECENLEAIFATETEAESYKAELLRGPMWKHKGFGYADDTRFYGRADLLSVRCIELGQPIKELKVTRHP